ncbi:AEC family transporter [Halospeciosus flavus]|uniref:AEC family transporter n=1 Tax=Halospeciosus flavus TaxID=3032283 RepID=UPI00360B5B00
MARPAHDRADRRPDRVRLLPRPPRTHLLLDGHEVAGVGVLPALVFGFLFVLCAVAAVGWVVHRRASSPATRSVAVVQSYHTNLGFLGLPIVAMTFGDLVTAKASLLLGVGALVQTPVTVLVLTFLNDADASLRSELRGVVTNPVLAALVVGLVCSATGFVPPAAVLSGASTVGSLALPAALLSVGASLSFDADDVDPSIVTSVVALKVLVMPLVALVAFSLLAVDDAGVKAGTVMLAMPTAISTFVYADQLGGDTRLASTTVFTSTVVSLGVVLVLVQFFG